MSTDRSCCGRERPLDAPSPVRRWAAGGAVGWGLAAVLLPKCPACVAGYLSVLGIGMGVGTAIGGMLRPACVMLALVAIALMLARRTHEATTRVERRPVGR